MIQSAYKMMILACVLLPARSWPGRRDHGCRDSTNCNCGHPHWAGIPEPVNDEQVKLAQDLGSIWSAG